LIIYRSTTKIIAVIQFQKLRRHSTYPDVTQNRLSIETAIRM